MRANGARYRDVVQFFLSKSQDMDDTFQQDGVTCRTTREIVESLHESFPVISRSGDQNWPCELFLWGFSKSKVYADDLERGN